MNKKLNVLWNIICVVAITAGIISFLYFYLHWQERQLLNTEAEIPIEVLNIDKTNQEKLSLEQKLEMIREDNADVGSITLKTGNRYSLYEARKQYYRELRKIPILEIDLYGPAQKQIDIFPTLIVDSKTPSHSMIVWSGSLEIKEVLYHVVLDEESGKLLSIQMTNGSNQEQNKLRKTIKEQWEKYFYNYY